MSAPGLTWQDCLKKSGGKLELLAYIDMLLMAEKGIGGGICKVIHRYAKANNKYMKSCDKSIEPSYLIYLDAFSLYGWAIYQKLPVNGFTWVKRLSKRNSIEFDERFINNYDENSDKGYFLEVDIEYPKKLFSLHSDFPFLSEGKETGKCSKLFCTFYDKENCVVHIKALKQALNYGLILKKAHRVIQFNQEAWLNPYIDINTKLRKEAKNDFEKDLSTLMNNAVFGKTMENARKHRYIKLVTTDRRRKQLALEPNYHTTKHFSENLTTMEMKKPKVKMNKTIYLGMSILDISKTLMY